MLIHSLSPIGSFSQFHDNCSYPSFSLLFLCLFFFLNPKFTKRFEASFDLSLISSFSFLSFLSNSNFVNFQVGMISNIPRWLEILLGEKFFMPCMVHKYTKKNEKNVFCLDCCTTLCPQCLPPHRSHSLLQVLLFFYFLLNLLQVLLAITSAKNTVIF